MSRPQRLAHKAGENQKQDAPPKFTAVVFAAVLFTFNFARSDQGGVQSHEFVGRDASEVPFGCMKGDRERIVGT
jgi:hypothetical protein